jgi:bacteriocin-like protein
MQKADKKKAKQETQDQVKPAEVTELADKDLKQVQGGQSSEGPLFIKPRK